MSLLTLLNRPCTIIRRTAGVTHNAYGDEITETTTIQAVCELQQRQRSESTNLGEIGKTEWLLVLPAGTLIGQGDTVTVDQVDYEVDGPPWAARNPRTQLESHIEATVCRTTAPGDPVEDLA